MKSESNASYFDIFGLVMVVWPAMLNVPIAVLAFAGLAGLVIVHRDVFRRRALVWAVVACVTVPALLFAVGWLLSYPLGLWPGVHPLDHAQPWPGRIALVTAGILVAMVVAAKVQSRADARALLLVNWTVLALVTVGVAVYVSGAAYTLLWPVVGVAIAGGIESLVREGSARALRVTGLIGFSLVAFTLLAFFLSLEMVLGFDLSQFRILVLIPFSLALVPLFAAAAGEGSPATRVLSFLCTLVVAGASALASQAPAFAANHPRGLNVTYYDDRSTKPRWLVDFIGPPDEAFLAAQGFSPRDENYFQFGLLREQGRFKPATALNLPAPSFTVEDVATREGTAVVRGVLRSGRGGFLLGVGAAPGSGIQSIRIDNQQVIGAEHLKGKEPMLIRFWGVGTRAVPMEVAFAANASPKLVLFERSPLPDSEEGRSLAAARPTDAAPAYSGDSALVFVTLDLKS